MQARFINILSHKDKFYDFFLITGYNEPIGSIQFYIENQHPNILLLYLNSYLAIAQVPTCIFIHFQIIFLLCKNQLYSSKIVIVIKCPLLRWATKIATISGALTTLYRRIELHCSLKRRVKHGLWFDQKLQQCKLATVLWYERWYVRSQLIVEYTEIVRSSRTHQHVIISSGMNIHH